MAVSYRTQATTWTTTSGNKTSTFTPALGDLNVVFVANTANAGTPTFSDDNADGLGTYTLVGTTALKATSADLMCVYIRNAVCGSATSTIHTMTPGATSGGGFVIAVIAGMTKTGASAMRSFGKQSNTAAGTPAPVMNNAPLTTNLCLGAVFASDASPFITPPASWTERQDTSYTVPATGIEMATRDSGETSATITWGSATATEFAAIALELDTTATPDAVGFIPIN